MDLCTVIISPKLEIPNLISFSQSKSEKVMFKPVGSLFPRQFSPSKFVTYVQAKVIELSNISCTYVQQEVADLSDISYTYKPKTEFVKKLLEFRKRYIEKGGRLYTLEEINEELDRKRK